MSTTATAASSAAIAPGTAPVISRTTIATSTATARPRLARTARPAGGRAPDGRRRAHPGRRDGGRGPPRALQEQRVADHQRVLAGEFLALALNGQHHQIAALGDHPREDRLADQPRPRGNHDLGHARGACEQRARRVLDAVLRRQRAGVVAEVARDRLRAPLRQQPLAEQHDDGDRADHERDAGEGELHEADGSGAGSAAASEMITLTGVPVSVSRIPRAHRRRGASATATAASAGGRPSPRPRASGRPPSR